MGLLKHWLIA